MGTVKELISNLTHLFCFGPVLLMVLRPTIDLCKAFRVVESEYHNKNKPDCTQLPLAIQIAS